MSNDTLLQEKIYSILPNLDERQTRLYLASEALVLGRGGKQKIATISKVSRMRIDKGIAELEEAKNAPTKSKFIRKFGVGRKRKKDEHTDLLPQLESIVSAHTRGTVLAP
jgi:hypothetical protein